MRRNIHFVVPKKALTLIEQGERGQGGATALAEYRWGTGAARHLFCARCGISPFYQPRSNPEGWAVTFPCLDGGTVSAVEVRQFDGCRWEETIQGSGSAIKSFSVDADDADDADEADEADEADAPAAAEERAPLWKTRPWLLAILEVLATALLPLVLILLATRNGGPTKKGPWFLPGKPQP